jgi:signal transduction histidine kinase
VLEEFLTGFGYEVISCCDGIETLEMLSRETAPELAIIDWMMPGMNGPEICRKLRGSTNPSLPYIMLLTAKGRKEDKIEALQSGADDFITKPFDTDEMRARVRVGQRIVDLQRQRIEEETRHYVLQLEEMVKELQQSRTRIVDAQEDVRRAIAEDLHGHVQTQMMLYMRLLDASEKVLGSPQEAQAELSQIAGELDELRENDIRQISHRLHPSIIKRSLCAGVRSLQDQYERVVPVEVEIADEVREREPGAGSTIPMNIRLGLYRVAEEAIGNVVKHSGATRVWIRLWIEDGILRLLVEDNGRGFEPDALDMESRSLGLLTIRDYMAAEGGDFEIESVPGKGTRVFAYVPLG